MEQSPRERATDPEVLEVGSTAPAAGPSSEGHAGLPAEPSAASTPGDPGARRGRRRLLVTAGVLSVALVGGGGALAASRLAGAGTSPAEVVPASALGFVSVDLDPSAGQKLDAFRFARKFPDVAHTLGGAQDLPKALFESLEGDEDLTGDWAKDVQPWLGGRAGVAVLPPTSEGGDPAVVVALAVTDADQARAGIEKVTRGKAACTVTEGFAVCSDEQAVADRAVAEARRSPLSEHQQYLDDLQPLGADGIARAWFDLGRLAKEVPDMVAAEGSAADATRRVAEQAVTGRAALALSFDGPALQLQGVVNGAPPAPLSGTTSVADLPADTAAAFGVGGADALVEQLWTQLSSIATDLGMSPEALDDQVRGVEAETGLNLPEDVAAAVKDELTLAIGGADSTPTMAVRLSGDGEAVRRLSRAAEGAPVGGVSALPTGGGRGAVLSLSPAYARSVAAGSGLGAAKTFRDAVPAAGDAQLVLFVDVARMLSRFPAYFEAETPKAMAPLAAFGVSARQDGTTARFTARLTTR